MKLLFGVLCVLVLTIAAARKGFGPTDQDWGYVEVREGAHIFWWLHYTTATINVTDRPLIIWLQGGPGSSASQLGVFDDIGPIDYNLNPRNTTWVQHANILFVDSPVGAGFSYVKSEDLLTTTNEEIARDFVVFLRGFYEAVPEFANTPLYIFSQSYGGKMAAEIALNIHQAIQNKTLNNNLKGVGLGNSWISPIDYIVRWAPYLSHLGYLDTQEFEELSLEADKVKQFCDNESWVDAYTSHRQLLTNIETTAKGINYFNVQDPKPYSSNTTTEIQTLMDNVKATLNLTSDWAGVLNTNVYMAQSAKIQTLMDNVKATLNLTSNWAGVLNTNVYMAQSGNNMKPVTHVVEKLLNETDITVAIHNGQLDMMVDTLGVIYWLDNLKFNGSENWTLSNKTAFTVNGTIEGYQKTAGNLIFYSVLRSGHFTAKQNTKAMLHILQEVTNNFEV